jgi:hypothetical protein
MEERKVGEMRRVRRKLGRVTVAKELVRNEEGRGFIYTWRARATPLEISSKCHSISKSEHLKEGGSTIWG